MRSNKGTAVIIAMLTLLILSTLGASIMFSTQAEIMTTNNFKRLTQARYAAEAGAQRTVNWLIYSYTIPANYGNFDMSQSPVQFNGQPVVLSGMGSVSANYPDNAVQTAFGTALLNRAILGLDVGVSYEATATLQTMRLVTPFGSTTQVPLQSWLVRSKSTLGGSHAQVDVTTTIEKFGSPVFSYAAFGVSATCGSVTFAGGTTTDSFDSSAGTYAATRQNNSGNIGSNGNINLNGAATQVNGTGSTPFVLAGNCNAAALTSLTTSNGATVAGGMLTLPSALSFAAPALPNPAPPIANQTTAGTCNGIAGCSALAAANNVAFAPGAYGDLSITGGTVHLSQGTYSINSLSMTGGGLVVDSGPVVLNFAGGGLAGVTPVIDMSGGTITNIVNGLPSDLQMMYAGVQPVRVSGSANSYGVVYAPNAPMTVVGSAWFGAVLGNTVTVTGGTAMHYDRSLSSNVYIVGNYHATSFGWSKY